MIYFTVRHDGVDCKIGVSNGARDRQKAHNSYGYRFYAAICGSGDQEKAIHDHFDSLRVPGTEELFYLRGPLKEYLEWLGTRAFAACSIDEFDAAYPAPGRFPWEPRAQFVEGAQLMLDGWEQIVPGVRKPLTSSARILATIRSDSDEWYTPPIYVEAARRLMGGIDLDPASCALANLVVRADCIFTSAENGLLYEWHGRVWLNPPYGNEKDAFVDHLLSEYRAGRVEQAVMCLNAHATDTVWFQPLWEHPICFTHHRPRFTGGAREARSPDAVAPTTGIAFVYVGPHVDRFADEFSEFGPILQAARSASCSAEDFRKRQAAGLDWEMP